MKRQEVITRKPRECELSVLGEIWHKVFGSVGAKSFFDTLYNIEHTIIAQHEDKPVAMGYIVPTGDYVCREHTLPCAMLYGIATVPEHRGHGHGAAVVNELIETAFNIGFEAVVLCPSEDSLFEYYNNKSKLCDWFYIKELELSFPIVAHSTNKLYSTEISPDEYIKHREKLLNNIPHLEHNLRTIEYQKKLCDELGGGLYKIGDACAIIEVQPDETVWVKELLTLNDDISDLITCITTQFEASQYIIRLPAEKENSVMNAAGIDAVCRFGMLALKDDTLINIDDCAFLPWYGPGFD